MAKATPYEDQDGKVLGLTFPCPGCGTYHAVTFDRWQFNYDWDKPTLTPSLLTTYPCIAEKERCHMFLRDGELIFLKDCSHTLAGKTVPLSSVNIGF